MKALLENPLSWVVVHIFHEQDREYYQLERLWSNGTNEVEVALDGAGAAAEA